MSCCGVLFFNLRTFTLFKGPGTGWWRQATGWWQLGWRRSYQRGIREEDESHLTDHAQEDGEEIRSSSVRGNGERWTSKQMGVLAFFLQRLLFHLPCDKPITERHVNFLTTEVTQQAWMLPIRKASEDFSLLSSKVEIKKSFLNRLAIQLLTVSGNSWDVLWQSACNFISDSNILNKHLLSMHCLLL